MAAIISVVASLIALLTASMAAAVAISQATATGCTTRELLLLSPCLSFISAPPNNLSATVPSGCCDAFSSAFDSRGGFCLCYFLREPQILGFPLNSTKLIALSSICPLSGGIFLEKNHSLDSICSAYQTLPPLLSSTIPGIQKPDDSPADENTPPAPAMGLPPSTVVSSPSPPPPEAPADISRPYPSSAAAKRLSLTKDCVGLFLSSSLFFLIHISSSCLEFRV